MPGDASTKEVRQFRTALDQNLVFVAMYNILIANLPGLRKALRTAGDEEARRLFGIGWKYFRETTSPEQFVRACLEVLVCRSVDAFLFYLSSVLLRVFTERPETLKSKQTVTVCEVLECADLGEFVKRTAERMVTTLAYEGLPEVIEYLNSQLKLGFDTDTPAFATACEFVQVRNIIVHNAGLVNSVFLRRTGRTDVQADAEYPLTSDYVLSTVHSLEAVAQELDRLIVSHFRLETDEVEEDGTTDAGPS